MEEHYRLTEGLLDPACYPHPAKDIQRLETHISTLFLAGVAVYKLKKPLDLGFLVANWPVVVDATFLRREQRDQLRAVAIYRRCRFQLLYCDAPEDVLRQRIRKRAAAGGDPSEADDGVLDHQLTLFQPPQKDERHFLIQPSDNTVRPC